MMITFFAEIEVKEGSEQLVCAALKDMLVPSRDESGCREYNITQSNETPTRFLTFEKFNTMEDLDSHVASDHYQNLLTKIGEFLVSEPKLVFTTELEPS